MTDWQIAAIVLSFLSLFTTQPTSLADVARREALRRQMTPKATVTLTNRDVDRVPPRPLPTVPRSDVNLPAGDAKEKTADTKEQASDSGAKPKATAEAHDEAWWHTRFTNARAALDRDQLLADSLQTRINSLTNDASARDDPAQRTLLYEQRTRAISEFDNVKKQLAADRGEIASIQEDARKEGIPAAWLR